VPLVTDLFIPVLFQLVHEELYVKDHKETTTESLLEPKVG